MKDRSATRKWNVWMYFATALGLTWLFWIPAALLGQEVMTPGILALHTLGGLGPLLAAIALIYLLETPITRSEVWRRAIDFKRIGISWYAAIALAVPLLTGLALITDLLHGGVLPKAQRLEAFRVQPLSILYFVILTLLVGPISKELGWRGYF